MSTLTYHNRITGQLFTYAVLGFAFAEATGLFALMVAFLLLYAY
jgi:F-type H+-transporting ATPase subunit c